MAYYGHDNVAADSPLRARWKVFLKMTDHGYVLRRDLLCLSEIKSDPRNSAD